MAAKRIDQGRGNGHRPILERRWLLGQGIVNSDFVIARLKSIIMKQSLLDRRQALALLGLSALGATPQAEVDLALVLAIDCSYSVNAEEYRLQMQGMGRAFMNPHVYEAIARGPKKQIALSAFLWSEDGSKLLIIPWRKIASKNDAFSIGKHLVNTARDISPGGTSISSALLYAQSLLEKAPSSLRQVVDVSTDGRNNSGPSVDQIRDQLTASGITINALAIVNEVTDLVPYLAKEVVSGDGSFVLTANSYHVYGEAILKKLIKEIEGPGVS